MERSWVRTRWLRTHSSEFAQDNLACVALHSFYIDNAFVLLPELLPHSTTGMLLFSSAHAHKSLVAARGSCCSFLGSPLCHLRIHWLGIITVHVSVFVKFWVPWMQERAPHIYTWHSGPSKKKGISLSSTFAWLRTDKGTKAQATQNWGPVFSLAVVWIEDDEPLRTLISQKLCIPHYAGGRYVPTVTQREAR